MDVDAALSGAKVRRHELAERPNFIPSFGGVMRQRPRQFFESIRVIVLQHVGYLPVKVLAIMLEEERNDVIAEYARPIHEYDVHCEIPQVTSRRYSNFCNTRSSIVRPHSSLPGMT